MAMVGLVTVRARLGVSTLAALVLLAVMWAPAARAGDGRRTRLPHPAMAAIRVVAQAPAPGPTPRAPRLVPVVPARLSPMTAMPLLGALVWLGVVGRSGWRVTDAGHDWRALLVGAPPPR